jgi:hypothetical protein
MRFLATAVLCMKRWDSLPVSTMWQWCVSRSSSAVVILASPNTLDHSLEVQVGGDHHAGVLVELAQQVEQQGAAGLAEGQVAQFIQDDQVHAQQARCDAPGLALGLLLLQRVDQIHRGVEPHPLAVR